MTGGPSITGLAAAVAGHPAVSALSAPSGI